MPNPIRFVMVLHNHQPVGNFAGVMEQSYRDSYLPFLDVFDRYPSVKICLHLSGSLVEWLQAAHPEYLERVAELVAAGRIEILGGAYFEPILTMIPRRDRIGQIKRYNTWLEDRFRTRVRGMWIPERVWEPCLASDLAAAGVQYTLLDDYHFKCANIAQEDLHGYYVTEDDGQVLAVFPDSERLRYVIPFTSPQDTIDYLRQVADAHPGTVAVFGDDGEKFGAWPHTFQHVYRDGWLTRFFDLLVSQQSWVTISTLAEAIDRVPPTGKVYLPECSYREMTEWALPTEQLTQYVRLRHDFERDGKWNAVAPFVRGGFWRNFKLKYPEADEMYSRMMMVSNRVESAERANCDADLVDAARQELYRAQCNCGFWHGAFGGIYLPHLRNAVYQHLISADNLLDRAARAPTAYVEATVADFNFDARQEVYLNCDRLGLLLSPHSGGSLYELDVRSIHHNLLATLARRPEAYHRQVLAGNDPEAGKLANVQGEVVFKQPDLDRKLQYDGYARKSLLDHFFDAEVSVDCLAAGNAAEHGDFLHGQYEARVRRSPSRIQVQLSRAGQAYGRTIKLTKAVTLEAGSPVIEIAYLLENLPPDQTLHFGVELNFAGMPGGLDDRYFHEFGDDYPRSPREAQLGHLGAQLDRHNLRRLGLIDHWLGLDARLAFSQPTHLFAHPIESVSQSEGGFELVHQSVAVIPHWFIAPSSNGRWTVTMQLTCDTSAAERRHAGAPVMCAY